MPDETATQANDVLGRECSEEECSLFEAYVDALGEDAIGEALRLLDEFPEADHAALINLVQQMLPARRSPGTLAPVPKEPRPDPNEPIIAMREHGVTVSRWGDEDEHPADADASKPSAPLRPGSVASWRGGA